MIIMQAEYVLSIFYVVWWNMKKRFECWEFFYI